MAVETSAAGLVLIQAKHTVNLTASGTSALGKTIGQFVRQFCDSGRSFEPAIDRFVLTTSPSSSAGVTRHLRLFLCRLHSSAHPQREWTSGNQNERAAALALRGHIEREWALLRPARPTIEELIALARLVHVHVLDVDPGGAGESEAKNLLRGTILSDPAQADAGWKTLIAECARYACQSQSANRPALAQALSTAAIGIVAPRSYQADINCLREQTRIALAALRDFAGITVAGTTIRITRPVITATQNAAAAGHLLVVGAPGAGKSGALHDLADALISASHDVVILAVDQLEAASLGALRSELNLRHEVVDVLTAWSGSTPAFLIIDALDAARTAHSIDMLLTLIDAVVRADSRWRIIASVRKFDLRYNTGLRRLFHGTPDPVFRDAEFPQIRHINVPELSGQEIAQVARQSQVLASLIAEAPPALSDLLRVPFNLRLLADLVGYGVSDAQLRPVRTQAELLDLYWTERVVRHDYQGDARETLLCRTIDAMVSQRSLRVDRRAVVANDATASATLHDLLSTQILSEWRTAGGAVQREVLTFPHHVLFDYAVARLHLPSAVDAFVSKLEAETDLLIALRPSIAIYAQRLWVQDVQAVWGLAFAVLDSALIPKIGKLLVPSVVAQCATSAGHLDPLVRRLASPDTAERAQGLAALRYLLATLLTTASTTTGFSATPWTRLLVAVTAPLTIELAYTVRPLLWWLAEHYSDLTTNEQVDAGIVARRLLSFTLEASVLDLLDPAIAMTVRTAGSAPDEAVAILCACVAPEQLAREGYRSMPALAKEVHLLVPYAPGFVRDAYVACFKHHETSTDVTSIGDSQVLPMTGTRKQDYEGALWWLGRHFAAFLRASPANAVSALVAVVDEYVTVEHRTAQGEAVLPVSIDGLTSGLRPDLSVIWGNDSHIAARDTPMELLDVFANALTPPTEATTVAQLVDEIVRYPLCAVIWRRLLMAGAQDPSVLGMRIRCLAWDQTILTARDTTQPAGEFIRVLFPLLTTSERERVENSVMAIPGAARNAEHGIQQRDRFLGCMNPDDLVTSAAKTRRAALDGDNGPPPNRPEFEICFDLSPGDPLEELRANEVEVECPETRTLLAALEPLNKFTADHRNDQPGDEQVAAFLPALAIAANTLSLSAPPPALENHVLSDMSEAIFCALTSNSYRWHDDTLSLVRTILLRAINLPAESTDGERDEQFATSPSWGMPNARVSASAGLVVLGRQTKAMDNALADCISALAADSDVTVRYRVAAHLNCVSVTAPALVWDLVERAVQHEHNHSVLEAMVRPLQVIGRSDLARAAALVEKLFDRTFGPDDARNKVSTQCAAVLMGLALWDQNNCSEAFIERLIGSPRQYPHVISRVSYQLAEGLCSEEPGVAPRAFWYLDRMLDSLLTASTAIEADQATVQGPWSEEVRSLYSALVRAVDSIALRLTIDAGALGHARADEEAMDTGILARRATFYPRARPLLEKLVTVGHPHTAQHTMELLTFLSPVAPDEILLLVAALIRAAAGRGYQYDPLAEPLVVGYIERFLAEHRSVLRDRADCHQALVGILDEFVQVGWPSAHRLVYRLDEIYR